MPSPNRLPRGRAPTLFAAVLACAALVATLLSGCGLGVDGHRVHLRGIRMYYEVHGRGPALVLLHGGMGNGTQFVAQLPAFQPHFRVIVPDLCAQGRTTDRPGPLGYHAMAEDVLALMDRLHVRQTDVVGWSDGGIVGLDLAIHHPDRVKHLVTFGANFSPDGLDPEDVAWAATASAESFGPASRLAYECLAPDPSHYEIAMNKIIAMWRAEPVFTPQQLGSIRAKTLIAAGADDDLVRPEHTAALARAIPGARMWIVPGATHGAILERPVLVSRTVLEFLRH
jgi:pimeloyl-ACP methyl ester carboxylesterase